MGIFDFLKKKEAIGESKETVETKGNACVGVLDLFPMKERTNY